MRWTHLAGIAVIATTTPLFAQAKKAAPKPPVQQVIPPKTVYWLSAATTSGFGMMGGKPPSAGDMMRMAMGGRGNGPAKTLQLDLGSKLPPSGPPAAAHAIPPGMAMGPSLALKTPKPDKPGKREEPRDLPEDFERPKGKLLLFWGCGETARPGQPVVIDFAKMAAGQIPPNLFAGERVRIANPPSASSWPTWGGWPNDDKPSQKGVPPEASLIGPHKVSGNYTPEINFTLGTDFMAGLDMTQTKLPSGALTLGWNMIPNNTGQFAQMMGGAQGSEEEGGTIVFWSSSELQTFISALGDYIAPAEAARLVARKQLMPPSQTSCAIPKEAIAATQGGLLTLVAHGPEENFIYPPRPSDPKIPWVQEWAVKARHVARTGGLAGMDMTAMGGGATKSGKPKCKPEASDMVGGTIGAAMSMFGKKKKKEDCE